MMKKLLPILLAVLLLTCLLCACGDKSDQDDTKTVTTIDTMLCTYTIAVEILDAACCDIVLRESCHELGLYAVVSE